MAIAYTSCYHFGFLYANKMTMKSKYIALAMMGAMMSFTAQTNEPRAREFEPPKPPKKVIPKGCKEFKFTYGTGQTYECIATSKKSADKKFKSFLKRNVGF